MNANVTGADFRKEILELLFLLLMNFFSIISFWITIPLSIFIISWCRKSIKKGYRKKIYLNILIFSYVSISCSILLQVFAISQTGDYFGGIRSISDIFHYFALHLSIFGGYQLLLTCRLFCFNFLNYFVVFPPFLTLFYCVLVYFILTIPRVHKIGNL